MRRRFDKSASRLLTEFVGAEIVGVDLAETDRRGDQISSVPVFADYAVLVFRDQHFEPSLCPPRGCSGDIIPEQFDNYRLPEYPLVSSLSNRDLEQTGRHRAVRGADFHTDHSNYPAPPKATILYGIVIPQSGGDTEFASVQAAYDDLPETTKRRIAGLTALHAYRGKNYDRKATDLTPELLAATPSATHPIARRNPDNGRTGLFLTPTASPASPACRTTKPLPCSTNCSSTRCRRSTLPTQMAQGRHGDLG